MLQNCFVNLPCSKALTPLGRLGRCYYKRKIPREKTAAFSANVTLLWKA